MISSTMIDASSIVGNEKEIQMLNEMCTSGSCTGCSEGGSVCC